MLLNHSKDIAKKMHKKYVRLDCCKNNGKLNKYYENCGFQFKGSGKFGGYEYNLWEIEV